MSGTEHDSAKNAAALAVDRFLTELGVLRRLRDDVIVESRLKSSSEQLAAAGEDGLASLCLSTLSNEIVPLAIRLVQLQGAADERRLAIEAVARPPETGGPRNISPVLRSRADTPEWLGAAVLDRIEPGGAPPGTAASDEAPDHPDTLDGLGVLDLGGLVSPEGPSAPSAPEAPAWLPAGATEASTRAFEHAGSEPVDGDVEERTEGVAGASDPDVQLLLPAGETTIGASEHEAQHAEATDNAAPPEVIRVMELPLLPAPIHSVEHVDGRTENERENHAEATADHEPELKATPEFEEEPVVKVEVEVPFEGESEIESEPALDVDADGDEMIGSDGDAGGEGVGIAAEDEIDSVVSGLATLAFVNTDGDPTGEDAGDANEIAGAVAELLATPVGTPPELNCEIDEREAESLAASFVQVDSTNTEALAVAQAVVELIGQRHGSAAAAEGDGVDSDEADTTGIPVSESESAAPPLELNVVHSAEPETPQSAMVVEPRRIRVINVAVGKQVLAAPLELVSEVVKPTRATIASIGGRPVLRIRGEVLPVIDLHAVLGEALPTSSPVGVAVATATEPIVLLASEVIDQREIEVRPLDSATSTSGPFAGVSTDEAGVISLLLDVGAIPMTFGPVCDEKVIELMPAA